MNDTYTVTTYVVNDDILKAWRFEDDCRATSYAAEILTVAVLAAKYFHNHHERALSVLIGLGYRGYCAAKDEKFFGWRLHLPRTTDGIPVNFDLLPAAYHDLTLVHELTVMLPPGTTVFGDKGYIPIQMPPASWLPRACAWRRCGART